MLINRSLRTNSGVLVVSRCFVPQQSAISNTIIMHGDVISCELAYRIKLDISRRKRVREILPRNLHLTFSSFINSWTIFRFLCNLYLIAILLVKWCDLQRNPPVLNNFLSGLRRFPKYWGGGGERNTPSCPS